MQSAQYLGFYTTPPLWSQSQFGVTQFEFLSFDFQSFKPSQIPTNIRLGHQMEYVFKQLLEHSDRYDVLLYNLQISREKITLGEIDFILQDRVRDQLIHVELTCKFYVIDPDAADPIHRLIGPNRRDSFFQKIEKIKNTQFPLVHTEEAQAALADLNIDHSNIEHQCCFKAQLFLPYGNTTVEIGPLNRDCIVGYWLRIDDLDRKEFEKTQYYQPAKSEWVVPPHDQVTWKSLSAIKSDIQNNLLQEYAPMLWMKKSDATYEKCFVVWW